MLISHMRLFIAVWWRTGGRRDIVLEQCKDLPTCSQPKPMSDEHRPMLFTEILIICLYVFTSVRQCSFHSPHCEPSCPNSGMKRKYQYIPGCAMAKAAAAAAGVAAR